MRRVATAAVFVAGVVATAATSPTQTRIDIPDALATLHLDQDQPAALVRIVITLNAEATSTYSGPQFSVFVDAAQPVDPPAIASGPRVEPRFIVTSTPPGEPGSSDAWEEEVRGGSPVGLSINCGIGPCERTFWFIAALDGPDAPAVDVDWHVEGHLIFGGSAWPTGAGGTITIDPPTFLERPIPDLVATTDSEVVELGPQRPAAARVIEVRIGAEAIPDDQGMVEPVPFALLSVDLVRRPGSGSGSNPGRPLVKVFPLDGAGLVANPDGPLPTPVDVAREADAFADCEPETDCVRRFLVTFEWTGEAGEDEAYDWGVRVRRLDLINAWSSPADLSVSVERRFDVDPAREAGSVHLEGEAVGVESIHAAQVRVELAASTTATDPILRLLPAPAVMTYRAQIIGEAPDPKPTVLGAKARAEMLVPGSEYGGIASPDAQFEGDSVRVITNPLAGCPVGDACQDLRIALIPQRPGVDAELPVIRFRWSLDMTLFEFAEAPLELFSMDRSPD
jgi:hypothetical protein